MAPSRMSEPGAAYPMAQAQNPLGRSAQCAIANFVRGLIGYSAIFPATIALFQHPHIARSRADRNIALERPRISGMAPSHSDDDWFSVAYCFESVERDQSKHQFAQRLDNKEAPSNYGGNGANLEVEVLPHPSF
jgi:hypothetical protein